MTTTTAPALAEVLLPGEPELDELLAEEARRHIHTLQRRVDTLELDVSACELALKGADKFLADALAYLDEEDPKNLDLERARALRGLVSIALARIGGAR